MANGVWTDERIESLLNLRRDGHGSSFIAQVLKTTRNAVIGKLARLGERFGRNYDRQRDRTNRIRRAAKKRKEAKAKKPKKPCFSNFNNFKFEQTPNELKRPGSLPLEPDAPFGMPPARAIGAAAVMAVQRGDCRFPIGDPRDADFRFCGAPRVGHHFYCSHHLIASTIGGQREQDEWL